MAHDVFISYAKEDQRVADAVCEALEKGGMRCWYAPRDVPYLVDYEEAIIDAISQSKLMLLVLSEHANSSAHVKREVQNACREEPQIPVLPFQIEDVPLSKSFRYYIGSVQWLVASTPPLEAHLQKLVNYVQQRLPQPAQAETGEKDEEEALRISEEVDRHRVEEEERLAFEAETQREAEDERQLREAEEARRAEEEAAEERKLELAAVVVARRAARERQQEKEEKERREAEELQALEAEEIQTLETEERQTLETEETARQRTEEERVRAEAESRKRAEEEAERQRVEAEQKAEHRYPKEGKHARAEDESIRLAEAARQTEEAERREREEAKSRQHEFVEIKRLLEEEERQEKERQAEERRTPETPFRISNLVAEGKPPGESSTEITAGDVPAPASESKNRRVVLIALGSLVTIAIVVTVWLWGRNEGQQQQSANQTATPTSTQQTAQTMNTPLATQATPTPSPTPDPLPTPDKVAFQKELNARIKKYMKEPNFFELPESRKIVYGDLNGDGAEDAASSFCVSPGDTLDCELMAFINIRGSLTYVDTFFYSPASISSGVGGIDLQALYIKDGKIFCSIGWLDADGKRLKGQIRVALVANKLKKN